MKKNWVAIYTCELCGETYSTEEAALECESRPISHDKGVKVGDVVKITRGEGAGIYAKVVKIGVASRGYGHYLWEHYWHTVMINRADLINSFGSRALMFDDYEVV